MRHAPPAISIGHYPSSRVDETLAIARELDGGIVDTLWVGDSPLIWRECWTTIALCLAHTETLRLGPAVTNPLSRDWTVTASALQTLSEYSPGRIRLGIGLGDSALRRQGGRIARLSELRDTVQAIRSLLTRAALDDRSEEHTSELQSLAYLVCRLLLEKKNMIVTFAEQWLKYDLS